MTYKIQHNVKISDLKNAYNIYPFGKMKKGDSFLVIVKEKEPTIRRVICNQVQRYLFSAAYRYGQNHKGFKVVTRRCDKGVMLWRK